MKFFGSNRKHFSVSVHFWVLSSLFFAGSALAAGGITVMPDESLFIQIANFIFLIWILNVLLYRPIRKILIQRKEKLSNLEQNIETLSSDAHEKDSEFSTGIKDARARGMKEKEALMQAAADQEREVIEKINKKAQADLAEVRKKIAKDAEAVRASLQQEIDAFAEAIGEKIIGRAI
jgi:F-type H+-transporting ATPase subunit b